MKTIPQCLFVLLLSSVLVGCASSVPYRYYTLQPLAESLSSDFRGSIGLASVVVPAWMDSSHLVYSDGAFQLRKLSQDRWGEPVDSSITRVLTQNLQRMNPDADVFHGSWLRSQQPNVDVRIEIQNLVVMDRQLVLEVSWKQSGLRHIQTYQAPISELPSGVELVKGVSQLLEQLAKGVNRQLKTEKM